MKIFVDTAALFAALVHNDQAHLQAKPLAATLIDRARLVTTNYVLVETCSLLQARVGMAAVRTFARVFLPVLEVCWIDARLHERALQRLFGLDRRKLSLVDCASFVCMDDQHISVAFTYDGHFRDAGYTVLRTRADLERR